MLVPKLILIQLFMEHCANGQRRYKFRPNRNKGKTFNNSKNKKVDILKKIIASSGNSRNNEVELNKSFLDRVRERKQNKCDGSYSVIKLPPVNKAEQTDYCRELKEENKSLKQLINNIKAENEARKLSLLQVPVIL